jgi:hypothetical protein
VKANAWRRFFEQQREQHGKVLFTVTELANVAGASRTALNVELTRLRAQDILVRYAHGLYGPPHAVTPQALVSAVDSHAYITAHYALFVHNLVTQVPTAITCFTDRRSPRARQRDTPVGRLVFVCVRSRIYCPPAEGAIACPAQALCDFVYLSRRRGVAVEAVVTFRNLARICGPDLANILARYPETVRRQVHELIGSPAGPGRLAIGENPPSEAGTDATRSLRGGVDRAAPP